MDLRTQIVTLIDKAIDGTINYTGKDPDQNRALYTNLIADRIFATLLAYLPDPVDVAHKYELHPTKGLHIRVTDDDAHNDMMLEYLAQFSRDNGYNEYRFEAISKITGRYDLQRQIEPAKLNPGDNYNEST
jgi:hypothetical protein